MNQQMTGKKTGLKVTTLLVIHRVIAVLDSNLARPLPVSLG